MAFRKSIQDCSINALLIDDQSIVLTVILSLSMSPFHIFPIAVEL